MSAGPICESKPEQCGTLSGYQSGGRCYRCRRANADKTAAERGSRLAPDQRDAIIGMMNSRASFDEAVREAGTTTQAVMHAARGDTELRCALEGLPVASQYVARIGDYLAALCVSGGHKNAAIANMTVGRERVRKLMAEDSRLAEIESLIVEYAGDAVGERRRQRRRISGPEEIAGMVAMLDEGETIIRAAERSGRSVMTLYRQAESYPELGAAMRRAADRYAKRGSQEVTR